MIHSFRCMSFYELDGFFYNGTGWQAFYFHPQASMAGSHRKQYLPVTFPVETNYLLALNFIAQIPQDHFNLPSVMSSLTIESTISKSS